MAVKKTKDIMLRVNKEEEAIVKEKAIEINNILLRNGIEAYKYSELLHKALELALPKLKVDEIGRFYIDK